MRRLVRWLAWEVFMLAEFTGLPLGPLAPHILGLALGSRGKRIK